MELTLYRTFSISVHFNGEPESGQDHPMLSFWFCSRWISAILLYITWIHDSLFAERHGYSSVLSRKCVLSRLYSCAWVWYVVDSVCYFRGVWSPHLSGSSPSRLPPEGLSLLSTAKTHVSVWALGGASLFPDSLWYSESSGVSLSPPLPVSFWWLDS